MEMLTQRNVEIADAELTAVLIGNARCSNRELFRDRRIEKY